MSYSDEDIAAIKSGLRGWLSRNDDLTTSLLTKVYRTQAASELAHHGLVRRLHMLEHAVQRIFEILPPETQDVDRHQLLDATTYLQAFVFNAYGALDNLARIWCLEARLRRNDGKDLPTRDIGLGPQHGTVRRSLSKDFQAFLVGADEWFNYLNDYRHALAHRVPLYIPPRRLDDDATAEYRRIEVEISKAIAAKDSRLVIELNHRQSELGVFDPVMMHSFGERAKPVRFHGQVVNDLATVVTVGEFMVQQLKGLPAAGLASLTTPLRAPTALKSRKR